MMELSKDRDQPFHVPRDERVVRSIELRGPDAGRDTAEQILVESDTCGVISHPTCPSSVFAAARPPPRSACGRIAQRLDGCRRANQTERPRSRRARPARPEGRPPVALFERVLEGLDRVWGVRGPERIDRALVQRRELAPIELANQMREQLARALIPQRHQLVEQRLPRAS